MRLERFACCLCPLAALLASPAFGALELVVTEGPGAGQTTWTFSGTGDLTTNANTLSAGFGQDNSWQGGVFGGLPFQYTTINNQQFTAISSTATISDSDETVGIDAIYIDDDGALQADDIGFSADATMSYPAGELVTWTGSLVVAIDIADVTESGPFVKTVYIAANTASLPELVWTVVPEPGGALLGAAALAALATRRERSRVAARRPGR